ncbi:hypothetical protein EDB84DRAFT_1436389 [Lactarius hengduanensis]|nr:hypothetical protein EDB84DRAFT_1436389 [Lactarius hengduanensis]
MTPVPACSSLPPAVCHVITVVVVAVAVVVVVAVVVSAVVAAVVVGAIISAVVVGAVVAAVVVGAVVAAVVVGAVVVAVVAACGCRRRCVWDLRCDDTGSWSFGWEGLSSAQFIYCFKSPDAQPRAARTINPHRRPAIDNSKTVSTTTMKTTMMKTTTIATTTTTTRRHDGLDGHQPPPPPPPPCHRQWQDDVNNSNNPDDDDDDDTDDIDDIDETTTTGHENNWTRRLGRDGLDATASPATGILTSSVVVYKVKIKVVVYLGKYRYSTGFYWLRSVLIATSTDWFRTDPVPHKTGTMQFQFQF